MAQYLRGFFELGPAALFLALSLFAALSAHVGLVHLENPQDDDADEDDAEYRAEKNACGWIEWGGREWRDG